MGNLVRTVPDLYAGRALQSAVEAQRKLKELQDVIDRAVASIEKMNAVKK